MTELIQIGNVVVNLSTITQAYIRFPDENGPDDQIVGVTLHLVDGTCMGVVGDKALILWSHLVSVCRIKVNLTTITPPAAPRPSLQSQEDRADV